MYTKLIGLIKEIKLSISDNYSDSKNKVILDRELIDKLVFELEYTYGMHNQLINSFYCRNSHWIGFTDIIDPMIISLIVDLENKNKFLENEIYKRLEINDCRVGIEGTVAKFE